MLLPVLLSAAGGFLDSFGWIIYGHVFTNAQTGNIILFGVYSAQGDWPQALRHVPPMLAFFPGVFAALLLGDWTASSGKLRAPVISLAIEIAVLLVLAALPGGVPRGLLVFMLAFVASLQSCCFDRVGTWSYNSVVTTGNLRTLGIAAYKGIFPHRDPIAAREALLFAAICASFAAGAILGGIVTVLVHKLAIAMPIALLGCAMLVCLRAEQSGEVK